MGAPAQGIPTIYIDSVDKTGVYVPAGAPKGPSGATKEEGLGSAPNEFHFVLKEEPAELDEIVVDISWDGGPDTRFFGGHIAHADPFEATTDGTVWYKVRCLDYRWEADWDYITHRANASVNAGAALINITSLLTGFTTSGVESGGAIDPYRYERVRYSEVADFIARDAAMLWDIDYSRAVRLFGPDAHSSGIHFNRQDADTNIFENTFKSKKNVLNVANRIIVEGDDGVVRIVEDTGLQPPVRSLIVPVPGATNGAVLNRVGAEWLSARKVTPWEGSLTTFEETLRPGDTILVTDSKRGLASKTVRIGRLVWTERPDRSWAVQVHWTTERVLEAIPGLRDRKRSLLKSVERTKRSNPRLNLPHIEPPKVHEPRVIPPAVIRNPKKKVPAQADEAVVHIAVDDDAGKFSITLESTHAATDVKLAIGAIIKARNPITVSIATTGLESGEGTDIFNNGTRCVEIGTTSAGAANRWTVNGDADEMEITVTGDTLENAIVIVFLANLDGVDALDAVTIGDNTLDVDVAVGRQKSYQFPLQVNVPGGARIGDKDAQEVIDEAQDGKLSQAYKLDRDEAAGYMDKFGDGRFAGGLRTRDGVNVLVDTDDGAIGPTLLRETGGPALNDAYAKSVDDMEDIQDGATHAKVQAAYLNGNRPAKLRRPVGGVDVDADDVFDVTREDTTDITEAGSIEFINGTYTDGSRRPITVRRVVGAVDVDVDDVFDTTREDTDDITESVTRKHISGSYVDGSRRPITVRRSVGGVDVDADDVFDTTREDLSDVPDDPLGTWRKIKAVNASGEATLDSYAAESVGNAKVAVETLERTRLADHAIVGRQIDEQMVDEFQNMGSGLSDTGWDNLET